MKLLLKKITYYLNLRIFIKKIKCYLNKEKYYPNAGLMLNGEFRPPRDFELKYDKKDKKLILTWKSKLILIADDHFTIYIKNYLPFGQDVLVDGQTIFYFG